VANDALDFGPSNTTRHFTCSGPATGAGDLCVGFWARDTRITGANFDYAVSRGTLGAVNSLQIFLGQASSGNNGQIGVRARGAAGTEFNQTTGTIFTGSGNDILIVVQKRGTAMEIYGVVQGATVTAPNLSSTTNVPGEISAGTWYLGARSDLNTSRFWQNPFGEFFVLIGDSLSAAEVEDLAAGVHITAIRATRAIDLRFRGNNATETDLSGNGRNATRVGTGYTLVNEFFPDSDGVNINAEIEAISLSTFAALMSSDRVVSGAREEISIIANAASVSSDRSVAAASEALELNAFPSAVFAGVDTHIAAALEAIAVSTLDASLGLQINAQAEQITLGTFLSAISSDRAIAANVESIALQTNAASVSVGSAISAGVEPVSLQTLPAEISLTFSLSSQRQSIVLMQLAAQVALAKHIDASVESLTITTDGATITLDNGIQAQLESLALTTFDAVLTLPTPAMLAAGLEYTLRSNRLHFTMPVNKIHFTFRS
jgi:hypothetical protein